MWATRRQFSGVEMNCSPRICFSLKTSQTRKSTRRRPSASMVAAPLTRAWAEITRQSWKRGCTPMSMLRSMKPLGSRGRKKPDRSRSDDTTRAMSPPIPAARASAPLNAGSAMGRGVTTPLFTSTSTWARAGADAASVRARPRASIAARGAISSRRRIRATP